jgi:nicotinamide riboside kinase
MINWRRKDTELSGAEVAELGHFGLVLARINLVQAADFEASEPIWAEFFSPADFARWSEFQPGTRRTAFVAARLALRAATEGSAHGIHGIYYDERRPLLPMGFVSMSHGGQWAVAAYHPLLPVGIDVEGPRAQIGRVIARVASEQEVEALDHRLLWGAKEAVYKAAGQAGLDWRQGIAVHRPTLAQALGQGFALESMDWGDDRVVVAVRQPLRVVLTGPESTGKTELAAQLAREFGCLWTPEIAREYLTEHGAGYGPEDVRTMARLQAERSAELAASSAQLVFDDTDVLTHRIWYREKYGQADTEIDAMPLEGDLYLLCAPDLAWAPDPLREHPKESDRARHFELYKSELETCTKTYSVVSGQGSARKIVAMRTLAAHGVLPLVKHRGAGEEDRLR